MMPEFIQSPATSLTGKSISHQSAGQHSIIGFERLSDHIYPQITQIKK
jgi:hypothetical protein